MFGSFVVKLKSKENVFEKTLVSDFFQEISSESKFFTSRVFKSKNMNFNIEKDDEFSLRFVTLDEESFSVITTKLFKHKILKEDLILHGHSFKVLGIYSGGSGAWGKTLKDLKIEKDLLLVKFFSPLILKHGSVFFEKFDLYLFFKSLIKNSSIPLEKVIFNRILSKITFNTIESYTKCEVGGVLFMAFSGSVELNLKELSDEEYEIFTKYIKLGYFTGSGYLNEKGYGMYQID